MRAIFISYRRNDTEGQAGRLFKDLVEHFGEDSVFMDVVDIEPGRDFRRVIDQQVASCGALLALIGKGWADAKSESGQRRLDDPVDFVRLETATALKRDIPVIPVLVQGARMPTVENLPPDLAELAYRNAVELTHARWDSDVQVLIKALRPYVDGEPKSPEGTTDGALPGARKAAKALGSGGSAPAGQQGIAPTPSKSSRGVMVAALVVIAVAVGGYIAYQRSREAAMEQEAAARLEGEKRAAAQAELERAKAEATAAKAVAEAAAAQAAADKAEAEKRQAELAAKAAIEQGVADKAAGSTAPDPQRPAAPAEAKRVQFDGTISTTDPCTGRQVTAKGTTTLSIAATASGVVVQEQFQGSGDSYAVSYAGKETFDRVARNYDIPIRGEWVRQGSRRFISTGMDRVLVRPSGVPSGDRIQSLDNKCAR